MTCKGSSVTDRTSLASCVGVPEIASNHENADAPAVINSKVDEVKPALRHVCTRSGNRMEPVPYTHPTMPTTREG